MCMCIRSCLVVDRELDASTATGATVAHLYVHIYIGRLGKHKLCIRMLVMFGERVGGVWCVYFCRLKFIVVRVRNGLVGTFVHTST